MKNVKVLATILALINVLVFTITVNVIAAEEDDWHFVVEPYLQATNIGGDTNMGRAIGADIDVDFSDILEKLEGAFMINGSAFHKSGWGVLVDYGYMKLESDSSGSGVVDAEVRQGVLEAFIAKQVSLEQGLLEVYTGIRWWDNDIDVTVNPAVLPGSVNLSVHEDWVDPVIGAQFKIPLSDKFVGFLRGDVGGFGIASDFTALVSVGFQYRFTDMISLDVRYKALWVDYETGTAGTSDYYSYKTVTHGPLLGVIFEF